MMLKKRPQKLSSTATRPGLRADHPLVVFSVLQFVLLGLLSRNVRTSPIKAREVRFVQKLQKGQPQWLTKSVKILSLASGSPKILNIASTAVVGVLWWKGKRFEAIASVIHIAGAFLVRRVLGQYVNRPRPGKLLSEVHGKRKGDSFPSGHVTTMLLVWVWWAALALKNLHTRWRFVVASFAALFAFSVGPTRVYLGDHWPTDVLGGYLLGSGWTCLSFYLYERMNQGTRQGPINWSLPGTLIHVKLQSRHLLYRTCL